MLDYFKQNKFMAGVAAATAVVLLYLLFVLFAVHPERSARLRDLKGLLLELERKDPKDPAFPSDPRIKEAEARRAEIVRQIQDLAGFYAGYDAAMENWIDGSPAGQPPAAGNFDAQYLTFRADLERRIKASLGPDGLGYGKGEGTGFSWDAFSAGQAGQMAVLNKRCWFQQRIAGTVEKIFPAGPKPPAKISLEEVYFPGQTAPNPGGGKGVVFPVWGAQPGGNSALTGGAALPFITLPGAPAADPAAPPPASSIGTVFSFAVVARMTYPEVYRFAAALLDADAVPKMLLRLRGLRVEVVKPLPVKIPVYYPQGTKKPEYKPEDVFDRSEYEPIRVVYVVDVFDFDADLLGKARQIP